MIFGICILLLFLVACQPIQTTSSSSKETKIFNEYVYLYNKGIDCTTEYNELVGNLKTRLSLSLGYDSVLRQINIKKQDCGQKYREVKLYLQDNRKYIEPILGERDETYYSIMASIETSIDFYS